MNSKAYGYFVVDQQALPAGKFFSDGKDLSIFQGDSELNQLIPNVELQQIVLEKLIDDYGHNSQSFTAEDLLQIESLDISRLRINSTSDLLSLRNLKHLKMHTLPRDGELTVFTKNLKSLDLRNIAGTFHKCIFPEGLDRLDAKGTNFRNVKGLPNSMQYINMEIFEARNYSEEVMCTSVDTMILHVYNGNLSQLALPKKVKHLDLAGTVIDSDEWPDGLKSFTLKSCKIKDVRYLPEGLTHLSITANKHISLANLPTTLQSFGYHIDGPVNLSNLSKLNNLTHFTLSAKKVGMFTLPESLKRLDIFSEAEIPDLPEGLTHLDVRETISKKEGKTLLLPSTLQHLGLSSTDEYKIENHAQLTSMSIVYSDVSFTNSKLPPKLKQPKIWNSDTNLDLSQLPSDLDSLTLYEVPLSRVQTLPEGLKYLSLTRNGLTNLPILPKHLTYLNLLGNPVSLDLRAVNEGIRVIKARTIGSLIAKKIPTTVVELDIANNNLTVPPTLPPKLGILDVSCNNLSVLPKLPSTLIKLAASKNQISTVPSLPESLKVLELQQYPITEFPRFPAGIQIYSLSVTDKSIVPEQYKSDRRISVHRPR